MAIYKWNVEIKKNILHKHKYISLKDLQATINTLKHNGKLHKITNWTHTSVIPLIIEHIFIDELNNIEKIGSIVLRCNDTSNKFTTFK